MLVDSRQYELCQVVRESSKKVGIHQDKHFFWHDGESWTKVRSHIHQYIKGLVLQLQRTKLLKVIVSRCDNFLLTCLISFFLNSFFFSTTYSSNKIILNVNPKYFPFVFLTIHSLWNNYSNIYFNPKRVSIRDNFFKNI